MTDREKILNIMNTVVAITGWITPDDMVDLLIAHGVTVREMQKPLTFEELRRIEEQPVWCETKATITPFVVKLSLIDKVDAIFYALGSEYPIFFSVETYGQSWRCWADKPTDEERKAVEWI